LKEFLEKEALICAQCHYCRVCPVYSVIGWESVSPRGRMFMLRSILKGKLEPSIVVEDFYKCTTCGACEVVCQTSIPLVDVWETARADFVRKGFAPLNIHKMLREIAEKTGSPYKEKREDRGKWAEKYKTKEKAEIIYFAGCTASYRTKELAENTVEFFTKVGIDFCYAGADEVCCGSPFLRTGQREIVYEFFKKNYSEWKRRGVKTIVTTCAGCYRTISRDYPKIAEELGYEWDFKVFHTVQIIHKLLKEGKIKLKEWREKITYHDPCHLGRHMGIYEEPREVLKALSTDFVEMERNRENALCCGAGGGVRSQFKEIAMEIGKKRIEEAKRTGAKYIISCCPFCKLHLEQSSEGSMEVLDIIEVVNKKL